MKRFAGVLFALMLVVGFAGVGMAIPYKNPAHGYKQGDYSAGVAYVSTERDLTSEFLVNQTAEVEVTALMGSFGLGLGTGGMLEFRIGTIDTELTFAGEKLPESDGTVLGASYRHNLGTSGNLGHGPLISYHLIDVDNDTSETEATQLDFGYGVGVAVADAVSLYGGGVFSIVDGTITENGPPVQDIDFEGDDEVGVFGGIEFQPSPTVLLGGELHAVHESGFVFYFEGRF